MDHDGLKSLRRDVCPLFNRCIGGIEKKNEKELEEQM